MIRQLIIYYKEVIYIYKNKGAIYIYYKGVTVNDLNKLISKNDSLFAFKLVMITFSIFKSELKCSFNCFIVG